MRGVHFLTSTAGSRPGNTPATDPCAPIRMQLAGRVPSIGGIRFRHQFEYVLQSAVIRESDHFANESCSQQALLLVRQSANSILDTAAYC